MNKLFLLATALFISALPLFGQQITLFDKEGEPRAYIDYDQEATIFMWDGTPVAFVEKDGDELCIFGFNGDFLGWYEDGLVYDKKGYMVGAREGALNMFTKMEKMKGFQKLAPLKPITPITPFQPILSHSWSSISLTEFLFSGKK